MLTLDIMHRRWPRGNEHIPGLIEGIVASAPSIIQKYGFGKLVVAHFMAQASWECGCGTEMVESLNYTSERLLEIFPRHFTKITANQCAHNQQKIGSICYGGRMGNALAPSLDGYFYRGRSLSQVTGKEGYLKLMKALKDQGIILDLINNPDLVNDPKYALECGIMDWMLCGCLHHAEKDDLIGETRALNGGMNGFTGRKEQLILWKHELGIPL